MSERMITHYVGDNCDPPHPGVAIGAVPPCPEPDPRDEAKRVLMVAAYQAARDAVASATDYQWDYLDAPIRAAYRAAVVAELRALDCCWCDECDGSLCAWHERIAELEA